MKIYTPYGDHHYSETIEVNEKDLVSGSNTHPQTAKNI